MPNKSGTSLAKTPTRQRILEAAATAFQSDGYARTTTQAIATKAGVAEVTIFRHFGDKQKLFQAVAQKIGGGPRLDRLETQLTDDLETDLHLISQHILEFFLAQQDAIRMLMFESIHFPEMKGALAQNPHEAMGLLERYFHKQMEAGKLLPINPCATAQAFISMHFGYAVGLEPVQALLSTEISREEMAAEFVRIFLAANAA
jgi:AcrR family transcriptional regulator